MKGVVNMTISRHNARQIFFDELTELCDIYGKFYDLMLKHSYSFADVKNVEYVRGQIYKVVEIAVKFGFTVSLYWDDTEPLYYRPLHGFTIY